MNIRASINEHFNDHIRAGLQTAVSTYDVIQYMKRELKKENNRPEDVSSEHPPERKVNPISRANLKYDAWDHSREKERDQLRDEILSMEKEIEGFNKKQAKAFKDKSSFQIEQRKALKQQLEELKTNQSAAEKFQQACKIREEKIRRIEGKIEKLKQQRTKYQIQFSIKQQEENAQESIQGLKDNHSALLQLENENLNLKRRKEKKNAQNNALSIQLKVFHKTVNSFKAKQAYCDQQMKDLTAKVDSKRDFLKQTQLDFQAIQGKVNALNGEKKKFLNRISKEMHTSTKLKLSEIQQSYKKQLNAYQEKMAKRLDNIHKSNQKNLAHYEQLEQETLKENQVDHEKLLQKLDKTVGDYFRYVNQGAFRIFNISQNEYLYAATAPEYMFDNDRRNVFTWREKNEPVVEADWGLKQYDDGTFGIYNKTHPEYLYPADFKPFDEDRRRVFTWRPGDNPEQGYWKLIPQGEGIYRIYSIYQKEYLYADPDKVLNVTRRHVFTWRPGGSVRGSDWKMIKIK